MKEFTALAMPGVLKGELNVLYGLFGPTLGTKLSVLAMALSFVYY